jgi:hypothetical protein
VKSRIFVAVMMILGAIGCGGNSTPAVPSPVYPNVLGTYSSRQFLVTEITLPPGSGGSTCPGSMTISVQTGDRFSGSFILQPCVTTSGDVGAISSGTVVDGAIRLDGGVTFSFQFQGGGGPAE